jgi:hypothetical protein
MPGRFLRGALTALVTVAAAGVPILGAALPAQAATFNSSVQETPFTNTWSPWKACTASQGSASDNCAEVHAMARLGNNVYLGGDFTELRSAGQPSITGLGGFAAIDATTHQPITSVALPRFKNTSGIAVRAIAIDPASSTIYVGGGFNYAAFGTGDYKISYQRLVAFTPAGTLVGAYNPNLVVNAMTVMGGQLYVGGSFTSLRTSPTNTALVTVQDAAAIDLGTGVVNTAWAPAFGVTRATGADDVPTMKIPAVTALTAAQGRIYVGGHFDVAGPNSTGGMSSHIMIAAMNPVTGAVDDTFKGVTNPINYDEHYWSVMSIATVGNIGDANAGVLAAAGGLTNRTYRFSTSGTTIWQFLADGDSQAVTVSGDDVYIGGHFVCVGAYPIPIQGSCTPPKAGDPVAGDSTCITQPDPAKYPTCYYDPSDAVVNRTHIAVVSYSQTVKTVVGKTTYTTPRIQTDSGVEPWNPQLNPSTAPYYFGVWDLNIIDGDLWVGGVWKTLVVPTGADIPKSTQTQTYASYPTIQKFAIFPMATPLPASTVSVTSSVNPSTAGTAVTFSAVVAAASGTDVPTGTVQFAVDGTALGAEQPLSGGTASVTTSTLTAGAHSITAYYGGDSAFADSTGALSGGQTINAVPVVGPLSVSVSDTTVLEGDSGTSNASFAVTLSGAPAAGKPVTVTVATSDGTATAGSDYTALAPTTLTWNAGDALTKTVNVAVLGDTRPEGSETFHANLSTPTNATLADATGLGTIADEEGPVTFYVNDTSKVEGSSGTTPMTFTVTASPAPAAGQTVTVKVKSTAGTATAGSDFKAVSLHAITFTSAAPTQTVSIPIIGDKTVEPNETVSLTLSAPSAGSYLGDAIGLGTIINDDGGTGATPAPALSVPNSMVVEGNSGTHNAVFSVSLPASPTQTTSVHVATADGTATAGSDYTAVSTTLTWAPGDPATKTVSVPVIGDTIAEGNETFSLVLSSPGNAVLGDSTAAATIVDEEGVPTISIADAWVVEGNSGTTPMTFAVSLSKPAQQTVTIKYATAAGTATGPSDFTGASGKVLTWAPGDPLTKLITIPVKGDKTVEANETFKINLSGVTGGAIVSDGQAIGTILNDD